MTLIRDDFIALDRKDPLANLRQCFELPADTIYLNGNSLGPTVKGTAAALSTVVKQQWQEDLITAWNQHGWFSLPQRLGEKIAPLIGAQPWEVIVTDSTSVNIFKLLAAALGRQSGRKTILSVKTNFPTDLYVAEGLAQWLGETRCHLNRVDESELLTSVNTDTAVVMLSHVDFRSGNLHDMESITAAAKARGALVLWDLCHSAGALPVALNACGVDLAVGCGYKYLNGGPGAPAFLFVAEALQNQLRQPLSGWFGHSQPFAFSPRYEAAAGINRFLCGTPPILAMAALDHALDIWQNIDWSLLLQKCNALTTYFIALVDQHCKDLNLQLASSRDATRRGSQVSLIHDDGYAVMQALIARRIIGDFRAPNLLRFGFSPLYTRYVDLWNAVTALKEILADESYRQPQFRRRLPVT